MCAIELLLAEYQRRLSDVEARLADIERCVADMEGDPDEEDDSGGAYLDGSPVS